MQRGLSDDDSSPPARRPGGGISRLAITPQDRGLGDDLGIDLRGESNQLVRAPHMCYAVPL